jgi:transcriptional regulator with XRE-family HTH domain
MATFGEQLKRLRGNRSQREVAGDLGMPVTTLSSLENQDSAPRGPVLKKLAEYYGVSPAYFFEPPFSRAKANDAASAWLLTLRKDSDVKEAIATHASADYTDEEKKVIARKISEQKRAKNSR